jgi:hypothetical protein
MSAANHSAGAGIAHRLEALTAPERTGAAAPGPAPPCWLRAALTDRESLRSWTQVANDGIIATAGILEGFAGAGALGAAMPLAVTAAVPVALESMLILAAVVLSLTVTSAIGARNMVGRPVF